jgi:hypothetical protein
MSRLDDLSTARQAVLLIKRRDVLAWPVAQWLAEEFLSRCLDALFKARGPRPCFVPETDSDLRFLFGPPASEMESARRARHCPTCRCLSRVGTVAHGQAPQLRTRHDLEPALTECAP